MKENGMTNNYTPPPIRPQPIITSIGNQNYDKRDIALWPDQSKDITDEQFNRMNDAQKKSFTNKRDMMGKVSITKNGRICEVKVSAWIRDEANGTRVTIMSDLRDPHRLIGSISAMTTYNQQPADGSFGLRMLGNIEVDLDQTGQREAFTISGEINRRYPDRELMADAAHVFGFPQLMISQLISKIEIHSAQRAQSLIAEAVRKSPAMAMT